MYLKDLSAKRNYFQPTARMQVCFFSIFFPLLLFCFPHHLNLTLSWETRNPKREMHLSIYFLTFSRSALWCYGSFYLVSVTFYSKNVISVSRSLLSEFGVQAGKFKKGDKNWKNLYMHQKKKRKRQSSAVWTWCGSALKLCITKQVNYSPQVIIVPLVMLNLSTIAPFENNHFPFPSVCLNMVPYCSKEINVALAKCLGLKTVVYQPVGDATLSPSNLNLQSMISIN